jgi:large subunit ribosomal protein L28
MAARINIQSLRKTFPAILDLPSVSTGNNIPKSYHKTRRTWHPNVHRVDQPLRVLETANKTRQGGSVLKGVKMSMRHLRTLEKSGGVEGTLVSQSCNNPHASICLYSAVFLQLSHTPRGLTPFGQQLRAEVFKRLTAVRDGSAGNAKFSLGVGQRSNV